LHQGVKVAARRLAEAEPDGRRPNPKCLKSIFCVAFFLPGAAQGGDARSIVRGVRITPEIRSRITALAELAPLHNPPSLATLAAVEEALPEVPQVAAFDTAFHATLPPEAST
jgi:hypothetical protein